MRGQSSIPSPAAWLRRFTCPRRSNTGPASEDLHGYRYIRDWNPPQDRLEKAMSLLEGGEAGVVFASGMGAAMALLQTLEPGAHVILPDDVYVHVRVAQQDFLPKWRIESSVVDMRSADATLFWLTALGALRRIHDALGDTTLLARGDSRWPAAVTRIAAANGRVLGATYDDHGNVTSVTDSSNFQNGLYATTRYVWNRTWDFDSIAAPPLGDSVVMSYALNTGNRLWQQDARGSSTRVSFGYSTLGLLASVQTPTAPRADSIYYNALGNDSVTVTPLGFRTTSYKDHIGRDSIVLSPTDAAQTIWQRTQVSYDAL